MYQGPLDSVLNFPLYAALQSAFGIPGPQNVTQLVQVFEDSKTKFKVFPIAWCVIDQYLTS